MIKTSRYITFIYFITLSSVLAADSIPVPSSLLRMTSDGIRSHAIYIKQIPEASIYDVWSSLTYVLLQNDFLYKCDRENEVMVVNHPYPFALSISNKKPYTFKDLLLGIPTFLQNQNGFFNALDTSTVYLYLYAPFMVSSVASHFVDTLLPKIYTQLYASKKWGHFVKRKERLRPISDSSSLLLIKSNITAQVFINSEEVGHTPISKKVKPGWYHIVLKCKKYKPSYKTIFLEYGDTANIAMKLNKDGLFLPNFLSLGTSYSFNISLDPSKEKTYYNIDNNGILNTSIGLRLFRSPFFIDGDFSYKNYSIAYHRNTSDTNYTQTVGSADILRIIASMHLKGSRNIEFEKFFWYFGGGVAFYSPISSSFNKYASITGTDLYAQPLQKLDISFRSVAPYFDLGLEWFIFNFLSLDFKTAFLLGAGLQNDYSLTNTTLHDPVNNNNFSLIAGIKWYVF